MKCSLNGVREAPLPRIDLPLATWPDGVVRVSRLVLHARIMKRKEKERESQKAPGSAPLMGRRGEAKRRRCLGGYVLTFPYAMLPMEAFLFFLYRFVSPF